MQEWIVPAEAPQDVAVLLFPRFSNHCLANAVEPLRAANDVLTREAYRWRFVTLDGNAVVSSSGLPVMPNGRLRDHPGGALLLVMSSYDAPSFALPSTSRALRAAARRFKTVAGMDTGAWLLAEAGLLDGRSATIHWDELTAFSEAYPQVDAMPDKFVIDGNMITCGGAMTAFDLVLALVQRRHGAAIAIEVAAYFMHRVADTPPGPVLGHLTSSAVQRAIALMTANLEAPLPVGDIAARVGSTQKTLGRAFRAELGAAPMTVYKRLRLASARRHAQQSAYSIAEIALRCGYQNAAAMTRAFVEEYGKPPSSFRPTARR